jgi:3-oxoacyl-[acyl-carrier protein] reductase
MSVRLDNRVAVITGGGSGIGLATARAFLDAGARVAVWDRAPEAAAEALADHADAGWLHTAVVDVRDPAEVRSAAERLFEATGSIDVLVNNAGLSLGFLDLTRVTEQAWDLMLETNVKGALNCAQAVVPFMRRGGWGRIVNTTSVLARHGFPGQSAYAASKAAVVGLTRVWARELGPHGITVNAVSPGYIATPMNARNSPDLERAVVARTPLGRLGEAEDVASLLLFLCSEEAGFIHGAVIPVDGGFVP